MIHLWCDSLPYRWIVPTPPSNAHLRLDAWLFRVGAAGAAWLAAHASRQRLVELSNAKNICVVKIIEIADQQSSCEGHICVRTAGRSLWGGTKAMGFPVAGLQSSYWYCCYLLPSQVQSYEPDTYHEIYMVSSLAKNYFRPWVLKISRMTIAGESLP